MAVAASTVRLLCAGPEIALVRASRSPEIERLGKVELKRHAVRVRKLLDKWRGLGRGQSRDQRKATGSSDVAKNTRIKKQIFRDALDAFEAQLDKPAAPAPKALKPVPPTSKQRSSEHRATRATMRKELATKEEALNAKSAKKKLVRAKPIVAASSPPSPPQEAAPVAKKPVAKKPAAKKPAAKKPAAKAKAMTAAAPRTELPLPTKMPRKATAVSTSKQLAAATAAKQSRVVRSGKTTRMFGHVSARGKRTQARRDTKR